MSYKILSIDRIDAATLPKPMAVGYGRWVAKVGFWSGPAVGDPQLTDDFVFDRVTQRMVPLGGDDWALESKEDSLIGQVTELVERHEDAYIAKIRSGVTGNLGDAHTNQHGQKLNNDATVKHAKVRALLNVARGKQ